MTGFDPFASFSNSSPTSIALSSFSFSNSEPVAITVPAGLGLFTNTPPDAIPLNPVMLEENEQGLIETDEQGRAIEAVIRPT